MVNTFKRRKLRKQLKEYLHAARHARHMREDIADPNDLAALATAEEAVSEICRTGEGNVEKAVDALASATDKIYPSVYRTGVRENVEVIIVALGAAMAIRAFFFQPFKIPTGSMQPTLNGIKIEAQAAPTLTDYQPLKFVKWLLTGTSYKEVHAKATGRLIPFMLSNGKESLIAPAPGDNLKININGMIQTFPRYMYSQLVLDKDYVEKGEVISRGKVIAGDHIIVNKMKYNFMSPERGDIAVFDTRDIKDPGVQKGTFFIKRMVGLPDEKIQIQGGHIVADGKIVTQPPIFQKIDSDPTYHGHTNAGQLLSPKDYIQLKDNQYLMMGDNTQNSYDSRYFGPVLRKDFQGPAMFVYWPFREHWGVVH